MKIVLFSIFWTGAICALVFTAYMEWWLALALIAFLPLAVLHIAETAGVVRFERRSPQQLNTAASVMAKVAQENITDEEAAAKYGWAIVNEMDDTIKRLEGLLKEAKENRNEFADMVTKGTK